MAADNISPVTEFILAGLTDQPELQIPLFFLFLSFYMVTVVGNLGLITLIRLNSHLHIPMYSSLFNLSFMDFSYSTTLTPKMLMGFVSKKNIFSYAGVRLSFFSSVSLYFLNPTSCQRWHMTAMSPSVNHWCTWSPCLLRFISFVGWGGGLWDGSVWGCGPYRKHNVYDLLC